MLSSSAPTLRLSAIHEEQISRGLMPSTRSGGEYGPTRTLAGDLLIKRLDAELSAENCSDAEALTHEARAIALAEVQVDLLSVERGESFFVWRGQERRSADRVSQ
jgi:hypothetical protein